MALEDVFGEISTGSLNRSQLKGDRICAIVGHGIGTVAAPVGTAFKVSSYSQFLSVGFTKAADTIVLSHFTQTVHDFFIELPKAELYIIIAPQTVSYATLADPDGAYLPKVIQKSEGKIRQVAFLYNYVNPGVPDLVVNGLRASVGLAIAQAQLAANKYSTLEEPFHCYVEAKGLTFPASAITSLHTLQSPYVTVVAGEDSAIPKLGNNESTAIGTLLGVRAKGKVNENPGYVEKFNIRNVPNGKYVSFKIGGLLYEDVSRDQLNDLDDLGFVFPRRISGIEGVYFSNSWTCDLRNSDFCKAELVTTLIKSRREVRSKLLPKTKAPLLVDADTGKVAVETCVIFEELANEALEAMFNDQEISGFQSFCDPDQDVQSAKLIEVEIEVVPTGTADAIKYKIQFVNLLTTTPN